MSSGYLVLCVQDYTDVVAAFLRGLTQTQDRLAMDLATVTDLTGLIYAVQASIERPVVLILENFENFFVDPCSSAAGRESFRSQLKRFREASFRYPACLVISIRQQSHGQLVYFQSAVPDIFYHIVALDLLPPAHAREAILAPLVGLEPPIVFDPKFLDGRLLVDLATTGREDGAIDPPHLQIVCSILYGAARTRNQQFIDAELYESLGGKRGTLGSYVERTLSEEFPDAIRYDLARRLLKAMASHGGEPVSLSLAKASQKAEQPPEVVLDVLDVLVRRSLVFARAEQTYGLSHPVMNETVLDWFDRKEAESRCAQDTLDHAWYDWLAWDRLQPMATDEPNGIDTDRAMSVADQKPAPLLTPVQLEEIASCHDSLRIEPEQHALLLRSAVIAHVDNTLWVQSLASSQHAVDLIRQLQTGGEPAHVEKPAGRFARVLGIGSVTGHGNVLGRTVISGRPADVRQAAALALASLGSDAIAQAFWSQGFSRRTLKMRLRTAQGLAWMRANGCRLPELRSLWLRGAVAIGERLARFRTGWRGIAVETLGAALGAAASYVLWAIFMSWLVPRPAGMRLALAFASGLNAAGLGFVVGAMTVLVSHYLVPESRVSGARSPAWQRIVGVTCGFVLGLAAGIPAEYTHQQPGSVEFTHLVMRYLIGGSIMGLGIAIGLAFGEKKEPRVRITIATCGAALGGLAIGMLTWVWPQVGLPGFVPVGNDWLSAFQYLMAGALLGVGLVGGWLQARHIWRSWQADHPGGILTEGA